MIPTRCSQLELEMGGDSCEILTCWDDARLMGTPSNSAAAREVMSSQRCLKPLTARRTYPASKPTPTASAQGLTRVRTPVQLKLSTLEGYNWRDTPGGAQLSILKVLNLYMEGYSIWRDTTGGIQVSNLEGFTCVLGRYKSCGGGGGGCGGVCIHQPRGAPHPGRVRLEWEVSRYSGTSVRPPASS